MCQQTIAVLDGGGFFGARRIKLLLQDDHAIRFVDKQSSNKHAERWAAGDVRNTVGLRAGLDWLRNARTD